MHKIEHDGLYHVALSELETLLPNTDEGSKARIKVLADAIEEYESRTFPKCERLKRVDIIVATGRNNVIGKDGKLPWSCPEDLAWFKKFTLGKVIIMGRNTWDSLPVKPLPDRISIVVTSRHISGVVCAESVEHAIKMSGGAEVVVIGGAQIYEQALPYAKTIYVSRIPITVSEPNVKFPSLGTNWDESVLGIFDTFKLYKLDRKD